MLLAADVGNSKIAFGLFEGEELVERWTIRTDTKKSADEYALLIHQLFEMRGTPSDEVHAAVMGCVVPPVEQAVGAALAGICHAQVLVVGPNTNLGIRNLYEHPEEVGADRLANAVGGQAFRGAPVIIVDFGTATTFDVVTPEGDYAGGVIIPGLEMSAQALFANTARLPRVSPKKPKRVLGRTTVASIRSGLFWGFVAQVDGLIERLRAELGDESWPVVATGGYAPPIAAESKYIEHVEPDLTLHGLRIIWDRNQ
ncbi:MAG: type III pantothenate kinase [Candidatus Sumerlaeota bacterium]|nr:type III pantothenate kinase [Candidatus Sumerlaeota bacterium]